MSDPVEAGQRAAADVLAERPIEPDGLSERIARAVRAGIETALEEALGDPERVAKLFHATYEELAPAHGWDTQEASRRSWEEVPASNRTLMVATAMEVGIRLRRGE